MLKAVRLLKAFLFLCLFLCAACEHQMAIVSDVEEREANEIIVFLASKGISASKAHSASAAGPAAQPGAAMLYSILVDSGELVNAMAVLNKNGLPRKKSQNLLDLFAKSGLVSSEREENIRYQAGLAAQIAGTIRKIDGVIDADVELSIPEPETGLPGTAGTVPKRITAAVYVKHQGVLDDPNSHLITKIKRLVSGSIAGLDINDVIVIADKSRFTDISLSELREEITPKPKEYVSIWSIVMSKASASRFRVLFFSLIIGLILFALLMGWLFWKVYPIVRKKGGFRKLFSAAPFDSSDQG